MLFHRLKVGTREKCLLPSVALKFVFFSTRAGEGKETAKKRKDCMFLISSGKFGRVKQTNEIFM